MDEKMEQTEFSRTPSASEKLKRFKLRLPKRGERKPRKKLSAAERKKRRKWLRIAVVVLLLGGGGFWAYRRFFAGRGEMNTAVPLTDFVQYGAITATVEGSGMTRAKNSETMIIAYGGSVQEVFVEEGDMVTAGQPLYVIDSEEARQAVADAEKGVTTAREAVDRAKEGVRNAEDSVRNAEEGVTTARERVTTAEEGVVTAQDGVRTAGEAVTAAQRDVETARERVANAERDLAKVREKLNDLQLKVPYTGKLLEVANLTPGDSLSEGAKVATLVDDTRFRLLQYYSYAYADEIKPGQTARVSIPSLMSELDGVVETVHMISRPTAEGSRLFSAEIVVENDGALAADMAASAAVNTGDEFAAPYDSGTLQYYRTSDLKTAVGGSVIDSTLVDYLPVREGQVVVTLDSDTVDNLISDAEKVVEDREKDVEDRIKAVDAARKGVEDAEKAVESARRGVTEAEDGVTTALRGVETARKGVTEAQKTVTENEEGVAEAQKKVEKAQEELAKCNAVAPIDGKVIGLNLTQGTEVTANTAAMTISDTSSIIVNATVDSRNISYIKKGLAVELNQWDQAYASGYIESVSLSSTSNNGVTTYPIVITVDSPDENFQVNSDVRYSLVASQNDNCLLVPIQCVRNVSTEDGESVSVVYVGGERPDNALDNVVAFEDIPEDFWPVPVEIGIQDTFNVEIRSGLTEGQEVFTQMQEEDYSFSMF